MIRLRRWIALGAVPMVVLAGLAPATARTRKKRVAIPVTVKTAPPPTNTPPTAVLGAAIGGCAVRPTSDPWNQDVSALSIHPMSVKWIAAINGGGTRNVHPDFGSNPDYGIPFTVVPAGQPPIPVRFTDYGDESDPGPYPIPLSAKIEAGGDRHVLAVQQGSCKLYELYNASVVNGAWQASSGAVWDLNNSALRPEGWTSADAAGLPILPGLARFDEIRTGVITHALRVTAPQTQRAYIHPATHFAGRADPSLPPMGARIRMRADFDTSGYKGDALVVLTALKRYGMIVADNGSPWFVTGSTDSRWNDDDLNQLKNVPGTAFEVVDTGPLVTQ